ncbi:hypothetical protein SPI_06894 [Niveomyces insectorum RCEF 264]|uniref:Uncharacterized protein n=1 Tax=Niveomyces insectorum RCEF 264 TaxID=1081102 RepID=A0A167QVK3_9HYPO|nr:hypothetical protein SPI_06894 [Niveomyces insectorum RCEF 264]
MLEVLLMVIGALVSGLWDARGHPGAMLDALLAPFSTARWTRHIRYKVDQYYRVLIRERLQSGLRTELLSGNGSDALVAELRQAARQKKGPLHRLFDEFAVNGRAGRRVWTEPKFAAFVASRLGDDSGTAPVLWRCFCYSATYPFTNRPAQCGEEQQLDLDAWVQAVALLATDAGSHVGRERSPYSIYGRGLDCTWYRFIGLSVPCNAEGVNDDDNDDDNAAIQSDDWHPPDALDKIAFVAATQLPIDMPMLGPPLSEIRPNVRKLLEDDYRSSSSSSAPISAGDFVVPYQDMVELLGAVLQVRKSNTVSWSLGDQSSLSLSVDVDRPAHQIVAEGILGVGGIRAGSAVSFAAYAVLSDTFQFHNDSEPAWCFEQELSLLWRSLFSLSRAGGDGSSLVSPDSNTMHQLPPLISQALDFFLPLPQNAIDRHERRLNTLVYASYAGAGLSRGGVLAALTWPYSSKLVVVYGHVTVDDAAASSKNGARPTRSRVRATDERRQPAMLAVMTSSPLWCTYETGHIDDFLVDDMHVLLEMALRPRVLRYRASARTTYSDLVDIPGDAFLSFGLCQPHDATAPAGRTAAGSAAWGAGASGLVLDCNAGVATLCSVPHSQGYVDIPAGPCAKPLKQVASPKAWTTTIRI